MNRRPLLAFSLYAATAVTMASVLVACGTPPTDLDLSLRHASAQGRFVVEMQPPAQGPAVGQMHAWTVKLAMPDGTPVQHAQIAIQGGMPQHGHGLPTQPRVTRESAPGTYIIEGMKFSMTGWWDLHLDISSDAAKDRAVFNVVMADAGLKR